MADSEEADGAHDGELASPIAEVVAALTRVERGLEEYERLLTRQTEVASRLHSENQELKKGELRQAQTSLILGVIRVLDDVSRMSETAEEAARSDLLLIGESLTDTLERYGVERLHVSPGDCFDGKAHKIAQVAPTGDEGMSRTVAGVTRPGFAWVDGTVIRVADVVVYKFVPGHESAAEADSQGRPEDPVRDAAPGPREPRA